LLKIEKIKDFFPQYFENLNNLFPEMDNFFNQIELDVSRTHNCCQSELQALLQAYSKRNSSVGYC
jgi:hypothetical protein